MRLHDKNNMNFKEDEFHLFSDGYKFWGDDNLKLLYLINVF